MKVANAPAGRAFQKGLEAATRYRWVIFLLMFLFYLINYADRANLGVVLPYVKKEFAPYQPTGRCPRQLLFPRVCHRAGAGRVYSWAGSEPA